MANTSSAKKAARKMLRRTEINKSRAEGRHPQALGVAQSFAPCGAGSGAGLNAVWRAAGEIGLLLHDCRKTSPAERARRPC